MDDQHPTLRGRVQLLVTGDGPTRELWVPTLLHLPVRRGDRVVLAYLANADEPVVMGVLDGFDARPPAPVRERAAIERSLVKIINSTPVPVRLAEGWFAAAPKRAGQAVS